MIEFRLKELLKERGRSAYWLAKQTGIRYATIWSLNRGEFSKISMDVLDRICEALDCEPGDLLVKEIVTKKRTKGGK